MKIKLVDIYKNEIVVDIPKTKKISSSDILGKFDREDIFSVEIPEGIVYITEDAFRGFENLEKVIFPSTLKHIAESAFASCNFKTLDLPSSINYIGRYAFSNCLNLEVADLSKTQITYVMEGTFTANGKLKTVLLPKTLIEIEMRTFFGCSNLTDIIIPDTVIKIGSYAFYNCTSLKDIVFPKSVIFVGEKALKETLYYNTSHNWENGLLKNGNVIIDADWNCPAIITLHGKTVIADYAFQENNTINEFHFAGEELYIGESSFENSSIRSLIAIAKQKTVIKRYAFKDSLLNCITVESELISLREGFCDVKVINRIKLKSNELIIEDEAICGLTVNEFLILSEDEPVLHIGKNSIKDIEIYEFCFADISTSDVFSVPNDAVFFEIINSLI